MISGGGCNCDAATVTISTGQPAKSQYAVVRVTGWDHNADCKRRAGVQVLRSPWASDLLEEHQQRDRGLSRHDEAEPHRIGVRANTSQSPARVTSLAHHHAAASTSFLLPPAASRR